jgi:hypothetical protein
MKGSVKDIQKKDKKILREIFNCSQFIHVHFSSSSSSSSSFSSPFRQWTKDDEQENFSLSLDELRKLLGLS